MAYNLEIDTNKKLIRSMIQDYSVLDYDQKLASLLLRFDPNKDFSCYKKIELHQQLNQILLSHYNGEEIFKYSLFKQFAKKKIIAAFEMKVSSSRVDFLTINGFSSSFEIKSNIDNLTKLSKQSSDYLKAFDFNYIVIDEKHLKKAKLIIPECFGIWSFKNNRKKIIRPAILNTNVNSEFQLNLLTKKEIMNGFGDGCIDKNLILLKFSKEEINKRFKAQLKLRYKSRWHFLLIHSKVILPMDIQFFFNTNIDPQYIYH